MKKKQLVRLTGGGSSGARRENFSLSWTDPVTGKRRTKSTRSSVRLQAEAIRAHAEEEMQGMIRHPGPEFSRPTSTELLKAFEALRKRRDIDWGDVPSTEEWSNLVEQMNRVSEHENWKGLIIE